MAKAKTAFPHSEEDTTGKELRMTCLWKKNIKRRMCGWKRKSSSQIFQISVQKAIFVNQKRNSLQIDRSRRGWSRNLLLFPVNTESQNTTLKRTSTIIWSSLWHTDFQEVQEIWSCSNVSKVSPTLQYASRRNQKELWSWLILSSHWEDWRSSLIYGCLIAPQFPD